jgi:hypothetical protein
LWTEPNERASHGVGDAAISPSVSLPPFESHGTVFMAPLAVPPIHDDLDRAVFGHGPCEVLVQTPILTAHHDEPLNSRKGVGRDVGQQLSQVVLAEAMRLGGIVQRLALPESSGQAFSLAPDTDRFHSSRVLNWCIENHS